MSVISRTLGFGRRQMRAAAAARAGPMWYASMVPDSLIEAADSAVKYAQTARLYHARRTQKNSAQRLTDIHVALDRLRDAMDPLRRRISALPFRPVDDATDAKLRAASRALQVERRKLWKMLPRRKVDDD